MIIYGIAFLLLATTLPPFLKALGRKRTPVPTKAFPSNKLAFSAETVPFTGGSSDAILPSSWIYVATRDPIAGRASFSFESAPSTKDDALEMTPFSAALSSAPTKEVLLDRVPPKFSYMEV